MEPIDVTQYEAIFAMEEAAQDALKEHLSRCGVTSQIIVGESSETIEGDCVQIATSEQPDGVAYTTSQYTGIGEGEAGARKMEVLFVIQAPRGAQNSAAKITRKIRAALLRGIMKKHFRPAPFVCWPKSVIFLGKQSGTSGELDVVNLRYSMMLEAPDSAWQPNLFNNNKA